MKTKELDLMNTSAEANSLDLSAESILKEIAENRLVERIISNIIKEPCVEEYQDLAQEIYISLFTKQDVLIDIYNNGSINTYIGRAVKNQVFSKTSDFYRLYRKFKYEEIAKRFDNCEYLPGT